MAAIKSVIGKLRHQVEDLFRCFLFNAALDRTVDELMLMLRHFRLLFLTHRPTHKIGIAKTVAS